MFSMVEVFRAKLLRLLWEHVSIPPSFLAREIASDDWMFGLARSIDREQPFQWVGGASFVGKKVRWLLDEDPVKVAKHFTGEPFVMMPLGTVFNEIYCACKALAQKDHLINGEPK